MVINGSHPMIGNGKRPRSLVPRPGLALGLLFCLLLFFLVILGVAMPLLARVFARPEAAVRIGAVAQDVFLFIVPAVATAVVVTRLPARLLAIDRLPSFVVIMIAVITLCASIPAMNFIVDWNQNLTLPSSMSQLEAKIRALEDTARATVDLLMGGNTVGALIVAILIMGILTGLAEELFFRGALQRLLSMTRMNIHAVIWLTAAIFSFFHFQFFGFVPRLLLGAFFGYTLYWSGSLWLPVILHALNNSIVVAATWRAARTGAEAGSSAIEKVGTDIGADVPFLLVSVVIIVAGLWLLWKQRLRAPQPTA